MRDFTFNGVSLRNIGGRIVEKPFHTIAKRRIDRVKIYGRSGDDFVDSGSYENVDFSVCSVCAQKAPARPGLPWSCPPA